MLAMQFLVQVAIPGLPLICGLHWINRPENWQQSTMYHKLCIDKVANFFTYAMNLITLVKPCRPDVCAVIWCDSKP